MVDHTFFAFKDIDILDTEKEALTWMLRWVKSRFGLLDLHATAGHLALAVDASGHFVDELGVLKALRTALSRLLDATASLAWPLDSTLLGGATPTEMPEDFFSAESCHPGNAYWPITESGKDPKLYACADSWAYHCVVNGLVHPVSRRRIVRFGWLRGTNVGKANQTSWELPRFLDMSLERRNALAAAMKVPPKVCLAGPMPLRHFELLYAVPEDRSMLALLDDLDYGPNDFEYMQAADDALLAASIEPMALLLNMVTGGRT